MQSRWVHLRDDGFEALVDLSEIASAQRFTRRDLYPADDGYFFRLKVNTSRSFYVFGVVEGDNCDSVVLGRKLWDAYRSWCEERVAEAL